MSHSLVLPTSVREEGLGWNQKEQGKQPIKSVNTGFDYQIFVIVAKENSLNRIM